MCKPRATTTTTKATFFRENETYERRQMQPWVMQIGNSVRMFVFHQTIIDIEIIIVTLEHILVIIYQLILTKKKFKY